MSSSANGNRYTREDWLPLEGLTYGEAAARLGATPGAATRAAKRFGIKFKDGRKRAHKPKVPDWKWRRLGMRNLSAKEAAAITGQSFQNANKAAARLGFKWRDTRGENVSKRLADPEHKARVMRGLNHGAFAPRLNEDERAEYKRLIHTKAFPASEALALIGRADLLEAHA